MFVQWDCETGKVTQGPQGTAGPGDNWYPMVTIGGDENLRHYEAKYELNEDAGIVLEIITGKAVSYGLSRSSAYDSVREQLDKLWHDIDNDRLDKSGSFYIHRKSVKDTFPKDK
ncbi:MAG: hypothetical protein GY727_00495 [Gammaproteobacteria bacterium]|nr:hypothetical protein [Gammaproteobacteria bacterium]